MAESVLVDDHRLFADFRLRMVGLGLVASWLVLAVIVAHTIRMGAFDDPRIWGPSAAAALGLAALPLIPWREALLRPVGDLLLVLWLVLNILLISAVSTVEGLAGSIFFLYFAVIAFSAALFPATVHALVAALALLGHVVSSRGADVESLMLELLALSTVALVTGLVGEEFRRHARREHRQVAELRRREADLARLYEVSRTLAVGESMAQVLPELVGRIAYYLKARVGAVLLYRPEHQALEVVSPIWVAERTLPVEEYRLPLARGGTIERVFLEGTSVLSNDLASDPAVQDTLLDDLHATSAMVVPLRVEARTIGALLMGDHAEGGFTDADLEALESLAAPAALVLGQVARYQEAEETGKRMEELAQLKTDFVSVVSHELRTPLTSIIGSLATLARPELAPDQPAGKDLLETARKQAERLRGLIEDLLMASRIDARALPQHAEDLDMHTFIGETVSAVPGAGELVRVDVAGYLPLEADPDHLRRIITNLVDNALKHAPGSRVEVSARRAGDEVWISVADHGPGIPETDRQRVFERFSQLQRAQTRAHGGTGLGLAIVKSLAEAMGGRAWLEETPGGGSTFIVALPRLPGVAGRATAGGSLVRGAGPK